MKNTNLLSDEPSGADAFGPHKRIANELVRIISAATGSRSPRSVGLLGDWGSGKSSVIRMMKDGLEKILGQTARFHLFIYDAWAHEGDELRRAFLDTLVESLGSDLEDSEKKKVKNRIWKKEETTETRTVPVLRRHGKILLLSLFLSPIFLRFYQSPPAQWSDVAKCVWNYVSFFGIFLPLFTFIILFVARVAPIKLAQRWLLGTDDKDEIAKLRVSSVFFQRTEGQIDIKTTTNPSDSIREFNSIFRDICELSIDKGINIVFVVDNIDRLGPEEARLFWATMQSFLDPGLWRRDGDAEKVFFVVPLSPKALSSTFSADAESSQSFADKTFDLSIYVPPPIQVNSREFTLGILKSAFPDHDTRGLEIVRDLYDYHRSDSKKLGQAGDAETSRRTPRQMKLFVNQLVALYRIRGDELPLEVMAAYLLCRDRINIDGLSPHDHLSPQQLYLLPSEPDVVQQLAAVHFGVSLATAAQVILFEPIRQALWDDSLSKLTSLADSSGFCDVLKLAIGTRDGEATVLETLKVVCAIAEHPEASTQRYSQVWNALLNNLRHAITLGEIDEQACDGLQILYNRLQDSEKPILLSVVQAGLSRTWGSYRTASKGSAGSTSAFEKQMNVARGIVNVIRMLAELELLGDIGDLHLSVHADVATRLVEEVSQAKNSKELARAITLEVVQGDVSQSIADWPGVSWGPTIPHAFIQTAGEVRGYSPDWPQLVALLGERFASVDSGVGEMNAGLRILLGVGAIHSKVGAEKVIAGLFTDGTLATVLQDAESDELFGAVVAAFLVFAPSANASPFVLPNGRPATTLESLLAGAEIEGAILDSATDAIVEIGRPSAAFYNAVQHPKAATVGAEIVTRLISRGHGFHLVRYTLVRAQKFIISLQEKVSVPSFYEKLSSREIVLKELNRRDMEQESSYTYLRVAATTWGSKSVALKNRLRKYVGAANSDQWFAAITANSDQANLMYTLRSLVRLNVPPQLGAAASDAIARAVEHAVSKNEEINDNIAPLVEALSPDVRSNLPAKIWPLIIKSSTPKPIVSAFNIMPDVVSQTSSRSFSELLNTALTQLLASGQPPMIQKCRELIIERKAQIASAMPAIGEFRSRASAQLRTSGLPRPLRAELRELLNILPKAKRVRRSKTG